MRWLILFLSLMACASVQAEVVLHATYLRVEKPAVAVLSNLDPVPGDEGVAGAQLAQEDNATTGRFLGHSYRLDVVDVPAGSDPLPAARDALGVAPYLVIDADAETVTAIADLPEARGAMVFSVSAAGREIRDVDCRANVFHTGVSYGMRADALMQTLVAKRWSRMAMIVGPHPDDMAWADALEASAAKFGLSLVARKEWTERADLRRTASGEIAMFTQEFPDHDVLVVADETDDFARYVAFNGWLPRPVAGSEGLMAVGWAPVVEQWGAAQLQGRFEELAGRSMRPLDYAAWAALRSLGEAMTRTGSADPGTLRAFILSDDFELAGFKGRPLSYRRWNGQLRQPVPVVHTRALVAEAPLEGFLHSANELDSLGLDEPESACTAFKVTE